MKKVVKKEGMNNHDELYCQLICDGKTQRDAVRGAYPDETLSTNQVEYRLRRFKKNPLIQERIEEIKEEFKKEVGKKFQGLKEELIGYMVDGVRAVVAESELGIHSVIHTVKQISTMMGYDAPKGVEVKDGGVSDNYKAPKAVEEMSIDELTKAVKGER